MPFFLRFHSNDRTYELSVWDEGESDYRRTTIDPWDRESQAVGDLDAACDELSELDRTDPRSPSGAVDLTFDVLRGWFVPSAVSVAALLPWDDSMVVRELKDRGVWVDGPPPWTQPLR